MVPKDYGMKWLAVDMLGLIVRVRIKAGLELVMFMVKDRFRVRFGKISARTPPILNYGQG